MMSQIRISIDQDMLTEIITEYISQTYNIDVSTKGAEWHWDIKGDELTIDIIHNRHTPKKYKLYPDSSIFDPGEDS